MGELYDYTNDFGGIYQGPTSSIEPGIAILDDDQSILNEHPYLGDELHPRNYGIIRRQTFSTGAGRKEGFSDRENFENDDDSKLRKAYMNGTLTPSNTGVKSSRRDWNKFENVNWNPRPPHYVADNPNEYSHIVVKQSERGNPTAYPDSSRMVYDRFVGGYSSSITDLGIIKLIMFFILILVICMYASYNIGFSIGKSLGHYDASTEHPASL